jgi:hypothetical protein
MRLSSIETLLLSPSRSTTYTMKFLTAVAVLVALTVLVALVATPEAEAKIQTAVLQPRTHGHWLVDVDYRCTDCHLQLLSLDPSATTTVERTLTQAGKYSLPLLVKPRHSYLYRYEAGVAHVRLVTPAVPTSDRYIPTPFVRTVLTLGAVGTLIILVA